MRIADLLGLTTLFAIFAFAFALKINDFLAIRLPVDGNILVVEGWIWKSSAMKEAMEEFKRGHYQWLVTVGEPAGEGEGTPVQESSAELAAGRLRELGVDENLIVVLPVPKMTLHRTYGSALTVRNWLSRSKTEATGVNVFTLGPHARKSLVLFERALGPGIPVGVIAGTDDTYSPSRWWLSARGIHVITRKTLGYLYAVIWPLPENMPLPSETSDNPLPPGDKEVPIRK